MKPPVYKTVTTKDNQTFFVDEPKECPCLAIDMRALEVVNLVSKSPLEYDINLQIVAQPLESNLSGIPYYELTPQEEIIANKKWPNWYSDYEEGDRRRNWLSGYAAAKAKEFTEEDIKRAWQVGFNVGYNDEESPSYLTADDFIKTLRQPMKIVSAASPILEEVCERKSDHCHCMNMEECSLKAYIPETYEKDGKTFIRLTFKYE